MSKQIKRKKPAKPAQEEPPIWLNAILNDVMAKKCLEIKWSYQQLADTILWLHRIHRQVEERHLLMKLDILGVIYPKHNPNPLLPQ